MAPGSRPHGHPGGTSGQGSTFLTLSDGEVPSNFEWEMQSTMGRACQFLQALGHVLCTLLGHLAAVRWWLGWVW